MLHRKIICVLLIFPNLDERAIQPIKIIIPLNNILSVICVDITK